MAKYIVLHLEPRYDILHPRAEIRHSSFARRDTFFFPSISTAERNNVLSHRAVEERPISARGRRTSYLGAFTASIRYDTTFFVNTRRDRSFFNRPVRWDVVPPSRRYTPNTYTVYTLDYAFLLASHLCRLLLVCTPFLTYAKLFVSKAEMD